MNQCSLLFLLDVRKIRIQIREAQKQMDPTDPKPQHCSKLITLPQFIHENIHSFTILITIYHFIYFSIHTNLHLRNRKDKKRRHLQQQIISPSSCDPCVTSSAAHENKNRLVVCFPTKHWSICVSLCPPIPPCSLKLYLSPKFLHVEAYVYPFFPPSFYFLTLPDLLPNFSSPSVGTISCFS